MPNVTTDLPITDPYVSIDDAITALAALEQTFRGQHDRRAIFATAYLAITRAIKQRVADGLFQDNAWAARYALCFANLYRTALLAFEQGDMGALPKAWRIAFKTSKNHGALAIQDLVLGINAHINHDLALALVAVTIDPQRPMRYTDHCTVNQVLRATADPMQQRIGQLYAPILSLLDQAGDHLDEDIASFSVEKAREAAWIAAVALVNARDDAERAALRAGLDDRSAVLARLILAPTFAHPWVVGALQHMETITPWTSVLLP